MNPHPTVLTNTARYVPLFGLDLCVRSQGKEHLATKENCLEHDSDARYEKQSSMDCLFITSKLQNFTRASASCKSGAVVVWWPYHWGICRARGATIIHPAMGYPAICPEPVVRVCRVRGKVRILRKSTSDFHEVLGRNTIKLPRVLQSVISPKRVEIQHNVTRKFRASRQ